MRGIFYNSKQSICSIWESGIMCYNTLKKSNKYELDYTEDFCIKQGYDFAIYNYHFVVNNWVNRELIVECGIPTFCIVTEISIYNNDDPIDSIPKIFDNYIVLDPTIEDKNNVYGFPRPLEDFTSINHINDITIIGSFGILTPGKQWGLIIEQVHNEFDEAIIKFNFPYATHVYPGIQEEELSKIIHEANKIITKPNIKLEITRINMSKEELINWCSKNTINCFFYKRSHINRTGLAAVTDQAISSGRPILVNEDNTFRHIHKYLDFYPNINIKEAIIKNNVEQIKKEWSSENFVTKFEKILF